MYGVLMDYGEIMGITVKLIGSCLVSLEVKSFETKLRTKERNMWETRNSKEKGF